jgi:hypothetical protein
MKGDDFSTFMLVKHFSVFAAWVLLFIYSLYILTIKNIGSDPYTVFHIIAPVALALVAVRSGKRFMLVRQLWVRSRSP